MSRSFMKVFNGKYTEKERIEYIDETINQLVRDFMDRDNVNRRKYYQNELKDIIIFRSNNTDKTIKNSQADAIINGDHVSRIRLNNGEWYSEYIPTDKSISKKFNELLRKNIDKFEKNINVKIKGNTLFLKRLMLITLYNFNIYYYNDDYKSILNKNKMKKLNEQIKDEFKYFERKMSKYNPNTIKIKKEIDLYLRYDNISDKFFKESKTLYSTFDDDDLEIFSIRDTYV